jgi:hypothetical protein
LYNIAKDRQSPECFTEGAECFEQLHTDQLDATFLFVMGMIKRFDHSILQFFGDVVIPVCKYLTLIPFYCHILKNENSFFASCIIIYCSDKSTHRYDFSALSLWLWLKPNSRYKLHSFENCVSINIILF